MIGRLHHDLITTSVPLPPGTKLINELERNDDEFVILKPATDSEKYKFKILNICLYMPIAQLSQSVYQEFSSLLTTPKDLQSGAVNIHYRRTEIRTISIPSNAQEFHSDSLFVDEGPVRLVLVLVQTQAKNGQYDLNPFEFRRSWEYKKKKSNLNQRQENLTEKEIWERRIREIERDSENRIREIQLKFALLESQLLTQAQDKGKGPKRGKKSAPAATTAAATSPSLTGLVAQCTLDSEAGTSASFERLSGSASLTSARALQDRTTLVDDDPDPPAPPADETGTVYVRKIELLLNGTPVDQVCCLYTYSIQSEHKILRLLELSFGFICRLKILKMKTNAFKCSSE